MIPVSYTHLVGSGRTVRESGDGTGTAIPSQCADGTACADQWGNSSGRIFGCVRCDEFLAGT